jgi:hypothetical protein
MNAQTASDIPHVSPVLTIIFPVITLVLGYGMKYVTDAIQHRRTLERDGIARKDHLAQRRADFQRETLPKLQEAVMELMAATAAAFFEYLGAYHRTGHWGKHALTDDVAQKYMLAARQSLMYSFRVRDEKVRDSIHEFTLLASDVRNADEDENNATKISTSMLRLIGLFDELQKRIGELLRNLDD